MNPTDQWLHDLAEWRKKGAGSDRGPRPSSPRTQRLPGEQWEKLKAANRVQAGAFAQLLRPGLEKDFRAAYAPLIKAQRQGAFNYLSRTQMQNPISTTDALGLFGGSF